MEPLVTFVATAHQESSYNRPFANSLLAQTDNEWKAVEWHNGSSNGKSQVILTEQVIYKCSTEDTGMYGCVNRQTAIEECDTEYIIQTSVQDYWLPQAVQFINEALQKHKPDILIWNSINHLVDPCQVLDAQLAWSKLDWGNFTIRTDIAKQIRIQGEQYCADWLFVKEALDRKLVDPKKVLKLNAVLTIHN